MNKTLKDFINGFIITIALVLSIFLIYKLVYINSISTKKIDDDYKVLFVTQDNEFISFQNVKKGDYLIEPAAIEFEGISFLGWYTKDSDELYSPGTLDTYKLTSDITFYAKYTPKTLTVSYYLNASCLASDLLYSTSFFEDEETPSYPYDMPIKEGYIFKGWEKVYTGFKSSNIIYVAIFEEYNYKIIGLSDDSIHLIITTSSNEVLDPTITNSVPAYSKVTIDVNPEKTVLSLTVNGEEFTPGTEITVSSDLYIDLIINNKSFT